MARTLKTFTPAAPPPFTPQAWRDALGMPRHNYQGDFLFVAATKTAARALLVECGESEDTAKYLVSRSKLDPGPHWDPIVDLISAGVVDLTVPAIYTWHHAAKDQPVMRVDPAGEFVLVAHFRRDVHRDGRAMYVEPVTPCTCKKD